MTSTNALTSELRSRLRASTSKGAVAPGSARGRYLTPRLANARGVPEATATPRPAVTKAIIEVIYFPVGAGGGVSPWRLPAAHCPGR